MACTSLDSAASVSTYPPLKLVPQSTIRLASTDLRALT